MVFDLILKGVNLYRGGAHVAAGVDVAIKDGKIVLAGEGAAKYAAKETIDLNGKFVTPSFSDTHMHIDKSFSALDDDTPNLHDAAWRATAVENEMYAGKSDDFIFDDMLDRSRRVAKLCVANGTTALKTNLRFGGVCRHIAVEATEALKKEFAGIADIYSIVFPAPDCTDKWHEAAKSGKIDFVGGYFGNNIHPHPNGIQDDYDGIDEVFELALEYGLPIDVHCNESDVPNVDALMYVVKKTMENQYQGKVSVGHATALDAVGMDRAAALTAIAWLAKACVNVESHTTCNMYLMDWRRRGPAPVRDLLDAGVNVSLASDNIQDPFNPFGNGDLMLELLTGAQVHKFVTKADFGRLLETITYNAAANVLKANYGTLPGCSADLVVFDAPDLIETVIGRPKKLYVLKDGKIVAKDGKFLGGVK